MIDPQEVEEIFTTCLYTSEELPNHIIPEDAVVVEGIRGKYAFNPVRIKEHQSRIIELLSELPLQFRKDSGGGWSFLNACDTKDGEQWTGFHLRMEQLFVLGMAIDKAKFVLPRSLWEALPGGMPYIVIDVEE